jgi:CheY-like chemotaxis protein
VRGVVGALLQGEGFAVWLAASGREALALYRRHGNEIDAVVLDVRIPYVDGPRPWLPSANCPPASAPAS